MINEVLMDGWRVGSNDWIEGHKTANPYPEGTKQHEIWAAGHYYGMEEARYLDQRSDEIKL